MFCTGLPPVNRGWDITQAARLMLKDLELQKQQHKAGRCFQWYESICMSRVFKSVLDHEERGCLSTNTGVHSRAYHLSVANFLLEDWTIMYDLHICWQLTRTPVCNSINGFQKWKEITHFSNTFTFYMQTIVLEINCSWFAVSRNLKNRCLGTKQLSGFVDKKSVHTEIKIQFTKQILDVREKTMIHLNRASPQ